MVWRGILNEHGALINLPVLTNTKTIPVKGYKTVSKAVKKLKAKKTYYVKIRAYQNIKVGKKTEKLYSKWSSAKKVKTRK